MKLSELSSQKPSITPKAVFVDANGNPYKVNVQAVELEGRPRLVRTLKNAGASVVPNVKDAAIILVDPSTECGRRLVRMWSKDPSTTVLSYTWARTSIQAGRALLQADGWGGLQAIDDGLPVKIDDISEDGESDVAVLVHKSPLPTPRITPDDPSIRRHEEHGPSPLVSVSAMQPPPASGAAPLTIRAVTTAPRATNWQDSRPSFALPSAPSAPVVPPQQQFHPPYHLLPSGSCNPPFTSSALPSPFPVVSAPPVTSSHPDNPAWYLMTMWDVVRHSGTTSNQVTWPMSNPDIPTQPPGGTPCMPSNSGHTLPGIQSNFEPMDEFPEVNALSSTFNGMIDQETNSRSSVEFVDSHPGLPGPSRHTASPWQSSHKVPKPFMSQRHPTHKKPMPSFRKYEKKGKEKTTTPSDLAENDRHSDALLPFLGVMSTSPAPSSTPPEPSRVVVTPRKAGEIFLSESGEALRFFVQVDLHGRHNVVTNIKKNRGRIVNNIPEADYVIATMRSKAYDWVLKEATVLEKIPIQAAFVGDCVEECALLNETHYALDGAANTRHSKLSQQNMASEKVGKANERSRASPTKSGVSKARKMKDSGPSTITTGDGLSMSIQSELATSSQKRDSSSPPPPPPETRQLMVGGKYYFTEAEDLYFCEYVKYLLEGDPSMSLTSLTKKLHIKMPHHSVISWQGHIERKLRGRLDDIRKRANILKRKSMSDSGSSSQVPDPGPTKKSRLSPPPVTQNGEGIPALRSREDLEKEDFDTICHFFASGQGDDDSDELVWQKLADYRPCKTANSWPEYYEAHQKEVYRRIEELTSERAQAEAI